MKVTDYYPIFYANDIEAEIKRFTGGLGFFVKHRPNIEYLDYFVLENANKNALILFALIFRRTLSKKAFSVCALTWMILKKAFLISGNRDMRYSERPMRLNHPLPLCLKRTTALIWFCFITRQGEISGACQPDINQRWMADIYRIKPLNC